MRKEERDNPIGFLLFVIKKQKIYTIGVCVCRLCLKYKRHFK